MDLSFILKPIGFLSILALTDDARFKRDSAGYSFDTVSGIYVHDTKPDACPKCYRKNILNPLQEVKEVDFYKWKCSCGKLYYNPDYMEQTVPDKKYPRH
jgi:hypothetical protein